MSPETEPPSGDRVLLSSASTWIQDALAAWIDGSYDRVAVLAPLAVEHLGKAALWKQNPVLVAPVGENAESHLLALATSPKLSDPKLRTIGLDAVLRRLSTFLDPFPLKKTQVMRMREIRNGAIHVGTSATSKYVLSDAVSICTALLTQMGEDAELFYGEHHATATLLISELHSEVGLAVAAKRAKARQRLSYLESELEPRTFKHETGELAASAAYVLDSEHTFVGTFGIALACPECAMPGRLYGLVDVDPEVDFDVEPDGQGGYDSTPYVSGWTVLFSPQDFACNVCRLRLAGTDELAAAGLPTTRAVVEEADLGEDFDAAEYAEAFYASDE